MIKWTKIVCFYWKYCLCMENNSVIWALGVAGTNNAKITFVIVLDSCNTLVLFLVALVRAIQTVHHMCLYDELEIYNLWNSKFEISIVNFFGILLSPAHILKWILLMINGYERRQYMYYYYSLCKYIKWKCINCTLGSTDMH